MKMQHLSPLPIDNRSTVCVIWTKLSAVHDAYMSLKVFFIAIESKISFFFSINVEL